MTIRNLRIAAAQNLRKLLPAWRRKPANMLQRGVLARFQLPEADWVRHWLWSAHPQDYLAPATIR